MEAEPGEASVEGGMETEKQLAVLDKALALSRVGDDEQLLGEMALLFLEEYPRTMEEVGAAIANGDSRALERAAHSLKGSVGNFGADAAYQAALDLEMCGRRDEMASAGEKVRVLREALEQLEPELVALGEAADQ